MIHFLVSAIEAPDDVVAVSRRDVGEDRYILIMTRAGMNARDAAAMAAGLLDLEERDAFRASNGLVSATEHPAVDVWEDAPFCDAMVQRHQLVDVGAAMPAGG